MILFRIIGSRTNRYKEGLAKMIMIYDKQLDELVLNCDECQEDNTFNANSFSEGIQEAKDAGWVIRRLPNNEWLHFCSKECEARYDFKG